LLVRGSADADYAAGPVVIDAIQFESRVLERLIRRAVGEAVRPIRPILARQRGWGTDDSEAIRK
jgi:hypothetical protein